MATMRHDQLARAEQAVAAAYGVQVGHYFRSTMPGDPSTSIKLADVIRTAVEAAMEALMDSGHVGVTRGELVDVRGMADMLAEHLDRILQGTYPVKDD